MKSKTSTKPKNNQTAEELRLEIETECRSGLKLIDSTVNQLAQAKFILSNVIEKSSLLFSLTKKSTPSEKQKNSETLKEKPLGKSHRKSRSRSRSRSKSRNNGRKRKMSSSSSSGSSCSTCSGGKKKPPPPPPPQILLLPSPRAAPLTKFKSDRKTFDKKKMKKSEPLKKPFQPYSYYKTTPKELDDIPPKHFEILGGKKLLLVLEDCQAKKKEQTPKVKVDKEPKATKKPPASHTSHSSSIHNLCSSTISKKLTNGSTHSRRSSIPPEEKVEPERKQSTEILEPETKPQKPSGSRTSSLSMFEELLEKTKAPESNRVRVATLEDKETKEQEKTLPTEKKVTENPPVEEPVEISEKPPKSTKPGPKSAKSKKLNVPTLEKEIDSIATPPPIKTRPKIGPKSRVKKPEPAELLPNSEGMREKLLKTFQEFQKRTQPQKEPQETHLLTKPSPKTLEILHQLKTIGEEDIGGVFKFGLDINSRMARFFATTDSDSDSSSSSQKDLLKFDLDVNDGNIGQFFLLARESHPLSLLRYEGSSSFTPIRLNKLTNGDLDKFIKSFIAN